MAGLLWIPIGAVGDPLIVLDAERRTYAGLSREGDYYHLVRPIRDDEPGVAEGNVVAGELTCCCAGAIYHGRCYRIDEARAFERSLVSVPRDQRPSWAGPDPRAALLAGAATFDAPAGAGDSVESFRG